MKKLLTWLKGSMEGKDGKSSARALTNFWYVFLNTILSLGVLYLVYYIIKAEVVNNQAVNALWALIWLIVIYNVTILTIFGIVTAQNINEGIRAIRGNNEAITVTSTTETEINQKLPE
jgi:hypothetical protein